MWCYYNHADEVELFINGKSQGIRKKTVYGAKNEGDAFRKSTEYHVTVSYTHLDVYKRQASGY